MEQLTTKKLKKKKVRELELIADQMATRLQWLHSTGKDKEEPEQYKRLALEIYHVSELIDAKIIEKKLKPKKNYGN
jgi:hypothetical protein|tara:strand:- start:584 stop:811 length:228 start_codon:yes stop_codon:yes gene_type:complete